MLIGEDPGNTTLVWNGPPTEPDPPLGIPGCNAGLVDSQDPACDVGNMLHLDGSAHIRVTRLTFDGNSHAKAAISVSYYQNYKDASGPLDGKHRLSPTGSEFTDLVLKDAKYGVRIGLYGGSNDAEDVIRRVHFDHTSIGVNTLSFNAVNIDVWDSSRPVQRPLHPQLRRELQRRRRQHRPRKKDFNTVDTEPAYGRGIHVHTPDSSAGSVYFEECSISHPLAHSQGPNPPPDLRENVGFFIGPFDHLNVQGEECGTSNGDVSVRVVGAGAGAVSLNNVTPVRFLNHGVGGAWRSEFDVHGWGNLLVAALDAEGATKGIALRNESTGRLTVASGKIAATGQLLSSGDVLLPDYGKILVDAFKGEANFIGLSTNAPLRVTASAAANATVLAFGEAYANLWTWTGSPLSPDPIYWNPDGPPTSFEKICAFAGCETCQQHPSDPRCMSCVNDPTLPFLTQPELYPQQGAVVPGSPALWLHDCQGYVAHNTMPIGAPPISYANVDCNTTQYEPPTQGAFYVEGATPTGNARLFNMTMRNIDHDNAESETWSSCADVTPPTVPSNGVAAIRNGLIEVRGMVTTIVHTCASTAPVTDARFHRITIFGYEMKTGFTVEH
jgi:hypothetical protein